MDIDLNDIPPQKQFTPIIATDPAHVTELPDVTTPADSNAMRKIVQFWRRQGLPDRNAEWVVVPVHYTAVEPLEGISVERILRESLRLLDAVLEQEKDESARIKLLDNIGELEDVIPALANMASGLNMRRAVHPKYPLWPGVRPTE